MAFEKVDDALVEAAQRNEPGALAEVVRRMGPLTKFWVRRMGPRTEAESEDLKQEGMLGVLKAVQTYRVHPQKGRARVHFGGWATYWIRAYVGRHRWAGGTRKYRDPAEAAVDIDQSLFEGGLALSDTLADEQDASPDDLVESAQRRAIIKRAKERLPLRLRRVWEMRFEQGLTLEEVGAVLNCSREYVRQMLHNPRHGVIDRLTRIVLAMQKSGDGGLKLEDVQDLHGMWKGPRRRKPVGTESREVLQPGAAEDGREKAKGESPKGGPHRPRFPRSPRADSPGAETLKS